MDSIVRYARICVISVKSWRSDFLVFLRFHFRFWRHPQSPEMSIYHVSNAIYNNAIFVSESLLFKCFCVCVSVYDIFAFIFIQYRSSKYDIFSLWIKSNHTHLWIIEKARRFTFQIGENPHKWTTLQLVNPLQWHARAKYNNNKSNPLVFNVINEMTFGKWLLLKTHRRRTDTLAMP